MKKEKEGKKKTGWNENTRFTDEQSIGEILSRITSKGLIADKFLQVEIISLYESIVGKPIARMTDKLFVSKGKLYLKVSSSALKQELLYSRGKIMEMINEKLSKGRIIDIVIM